MPRPQTLRKQPQQARSRDLVLVIVEAAARVFNECGYEAATTNQIANIAGVSVGSVYQYFTDKQSLLTALHEHHAAQVLSVLDAACQRAPERTLKESLENVVRSLLALHRERPTLQRILHDEHAFLQYRKADSPVGRDIVARAGELLAAYPALNLPNPLLAAQLLVRTVEELVHATILDPPIGATSDEVEGAIVRAAQAYLCS
jgi:AcrR family transcriptional regulator